MNEREVIIGALGRLARRLWLDRMFREAAFAACLILFCLLCFRLVAASLVEIPHGLASLARTILAAAIVLVVAQSVARAARPVGAGEAANVADFRASLVDELKSAHWFLASGAQSAMEALQISRAAVTVRRLDLRALVPARVPGSAWAAALSASLLVFISVLTPLPSRAREAADGGPPAARGDLPALLDGGPETAETRQLASALRELQRAGASPQDQARALAEARDAIDQANMDAASAREEMARLAVSLKTQPGFEAMARAVEEGRFDEAKALVRERGSPGAAPRDDPKADDLAGRAAISAAEPGNPRDAAGRDLGKTAALNQEALKRVEQAIEQAQERMEVQNRVNNIKRRMDDNLVATSQRSQLTASQFDNRSTAANPTPAPEAGNVDVRGGTLFRQAAVARESKDESHDGSQTGDASGDSPADPLEGAKTGRLTARLKLETILQKREDGDESAGKGDDGWFYSASREQRSALRGEDVEPASGYRRDAAMEHDRVPERQKNSVKAYFLNLHESESR